MVIWTPAIHMETGECYFLLFFWLSILGLASRLICDCARKAHTQGYSYIGIQYYAECWSSSLKDPGYDRDGKNDDECYNAEFGNCSQDDSECTGGASVNFIYKIVYQGKIISSTAANVDSAAISPAWYPGTKWET